jgi:hypothetical protein
MKRKWDRRYKGFMRTLAVDVGYAAKVYLTLPSDELRDILQALELGTINRNTFVIAVEKDKRKASTIAKKLAKLFRRFHVHNGQLHTLPLAEILNGQQIDLAFFDLCGQITPQVAKWLQSLTGEEFATGAVVSYTFNKGYRHNRLIESLVGGMPRNEVVERLTKRCSQVTGRWDNPLPAQLTLYALYGALTAVYRFEFVCVHEYHDTVVPMMFVQTTIVGKSGIPGNAAAKKVKAIVGKFTPSTARKQKTMPAWKLLGCPDDMNGRKKAWAVIRANRGIRPDWIKRGEWAWHPMNPNGHKRAA